MPLVPLPPRRFQELVCGPKDAHLFDEVGRWLVALKGWSRKNNGLIASGFYTTDSSAVRGSFAEWRNVQIIEGTIPETLPQVRAEGIAFLHLDLNCAAPEIAALTCFWDRLVVGAAALLDDYAYHGCRHQKFEMDELAGRLGVPIASPPTGQGLLIKT